MKVQGPPCWSLLPFATLSSLISVSIALLILQLHSCLLITNLTHILYSVFCHRTTVTHTFLSSDNKPHSYTLLSSTLKPHSHSFISFGTKPHSYTLLSSVFWRKMTHPLFCLLTKNHTHTLFSVFWLQKHTYTLFCLLTLDHLDTIPFGTRLHYPSHCPLPAGQWTLGKFQAIM